MFVALGTQHAMLMRHNHLWLARLYNIFFTLSHKWHDFREGGEGVIERKIFVSIFSKTFV
jgi:hypothetical protein